MAKKISDRERVEQVFMSCPQTEAAHLLDLAGVIVRSRFPGTPPVKRGRKAKPQAAPPIAQAGTQEQ